MEATHPGCQFQLRYLSLFDSGRGFSFPCDAQGHVDLDGLNDRSRDNYFYARAMVGRDYQVPVLAEVATQ